MPFWRRMANLFRIAGHGSSCHGKPHAEDSDHLGKVVIVGSPNVGKSVIFNNLTKL